MYAKNDGCLLGSVQHVLCTCSGILYEHAVFLEMAKRMDDPQNGSNQAILSQSPGQTEIQNKADPKNDSSADRAWGDEGIPASVSSEGGSDV